jgi:uncharacterized protein (TIGR00255 family)
MIKSMTGFGSGRAVAGDEEVLVEIKSVNHKFLETKVRVPREAAQLELSIAKLVKDRLSRGAVDVSVKRTAKTSSGFLPTYDSVLAQAYRNLFAQMAKEQNVPDDTTVRSLAAQPQVIRMEEPQANPQLIETAAQQALELALQSLAEMRSAEGEALSNDLFARLVKMRELAFEIQKLAPKAVEAFSTRLLERLEELRRTVTVDESRVAQEVALFAERVDIEEEMIRLQSHFQQFEQLLAAAEPVGRKMDFLVQEMNREVNTTGSKSQSIDISNRVVALKAELERVREQVQNVE